MIKYDFDVLNNKMFHYFNKIKRKILLNNIIIILLNKKINFNLFIYFNINWGLGIGDWGLGIGDWGLGPIPNPQSPIPTYIDIILNLYLYFNYKYNYKFIFILKKQLN